MFEIVGEFHLPATNQYTSITFEYAWDVFVRTKIGPQFSDYKIGRYDVTFRNGYVSTEDDVWHQDTADPGDLLVVWANSHPTHLISLATRRSVRLLLKPHQVAVFSNDDHVHRRPPNLTKVQIKGRKFGRAYLTLKSFKKVLDKQTTI